LRISAITALASLFIFALSSFFGSILSSTDFMLLVMALQYKNQIDSSD